MKKFWWVVIIIGIAVFGLILFLRGDEDNWIKDGRGVYVKHGSPETTPDYVLSQQEIIKKALDQFNEKKASGTDLSSGPCLGKISDDWVADLVHNPRQEVDDLTSNQCTDYLTGSVIHFIELNLDNGEVVKIN